MRDGDADPYDGAMLEEASGPSTPAGPGRLDLTLTLLAVLLATAWLGWLQLSFGGLYDLDSWFHVRAAEQLSVHGVSKTFPQATQSTWLEHYSDKDFLFHAFLIPFVRADLIVGGKWAVIALDFLVFASFAYAIRTFGVRFGALWVFLLATTSPYYVTRISSVRPHILGIALVTLEITLLLRNRWKTLLVVSALHVIAHSSFVVLPALVVARFVTSWLTGERLPWRAALAVAAGLVAGSLLHPYFPNNLTVAYDQLVEVTRNVWFPNTTIPREAFGSELGPMTWKSFFAQTPGWLPALVGLVVVLATAGRRGWTVATSEPGGWTAAQIDLALLTAGFLFVASRSRRFVDLFVVCALLFAGVLWTRLAAERPLGTLLRERRALALPCVVVLLAIALWSGSRVAGMRESFQSQATGEIFAPAVSALDQLAAPDDVVYHNSWMDFAVLYAFRPQGRYISGLDPIFLYQHDPELFAKNLALSRGAGDAASIVARDFGGRWIFVTTQARDQRFRKLLERTRGIRQVYGDPAAQIWQVMSPSRAMTP
ncbi:hypothetical protein K2Z84_13940 [Candidatus Binatia bacterium]|nr:hypothetical protein [Candidatus Binatia bacterium]